MLTFFQIEEQMHKFFEKPLQRLIFPSLALIVNGWMLYRKAQEGENIVPDSLPFVFWTGSSIILLLVVAADKYVKARQSSPVEPKERLKNWLQRVNIAIFGAYFSVGGICLILAYTLTNIVVTSSERWSKHGLSNSDIVAWCLIGICFLGVLFVVMNAKEKGRITIFGLRKAILSELERT
jgi:hypothetical protein